MYDCRKRVYLTQVAKWLSVEAKGCMTYISKGFLVVPNGNLVGSMYIQNNGSDPVVSATAAYESTKL